MTMRNFVLLSAVLCAVFALALGSFKLWLIFVLALVYLIVSRERKA